MTIRKNHMGTGTITFLQDFYDYMRPDKKAVLQEWINKGKVTNIKRNVPLGTGGFKQVELRITHPDFPDKYKDGTFRLNFAMVYNGWNKNVILDNISVCIDKKWIVVKEYASKHEKHEEE
jgi:hypothetical protein